MVEQDPWRTKRKSAGAQDDAKRPKTEGSLAQQILWAVVPYAGTPYIAQLELKRQKIIKTLQSLIELLKLHFFSDQEEIFRQS